MQSLLTAWLLISTCAAHQAHKHAAFHERHVAVPQPADPPSAPRILPRGLTTTLYRTLTETETVPPLSVPSSLPHSLDDLPPWADKLVEKILQAIGTACPPSGAGWVANNGYNDPASASTEQHGGGQHSGWNSETSSSENGHCSDGTCGNDGGASVDGHWPPSPPHNPHDGNSDASDSSSNWPPSSPPHGPYDVNDPDASASGGDHWKPSPDHDAWGSGSSKKPSSATLSRGHWSPASATSRHSSSPHPQPTEDPWPDHIVTGYYGSGQADKYPPSAVPWEYLTHLCYAFATTTSNYGVKFDPALLSQVASEAHRNGVKPVLSIGGYGAGGRYFSQIVENNATISQFVRNVKTVVDEFNLAGVDIDWEFVGDLANPDNFPDFQDDPETDADGYLNLLKALRGALGPEIELSAAVPMFVFSQATDPNDPNKLTPVDMQPYVPYLDRVYLMGYDLWGDDEVAGANAAMAVPVGTQAIPGQRYISQGIEAWGKAFPREKLVYGVPFYGYGYNLYANSTPETEGLYVPVDGKSRGDDGESPDSTSGFWRWRNLKSQGVLVQNAKTGRYEAGDGWQTGWNDETQTPYVFSVDPDEHHGGGGKNGYNGTSTTTTATDDPADEDYGEIISYDDPYSLKLKRKYAQDQGLGGMMFWIASADTEDGELASVLA